MAGPGMKHDDGKKNPCGTTHVAAVTFTTV